MKRLFLIAAIAFGAGLGSALWAGGELFAAGARADQLGVSGQLDPFILGAFVVGLLAASWGLIAATYAAAKWSRNN